MVLITSIPKILHRMVTVEEVDQNQFFLELVFNNIGEFNLMSEVCWSKIGIK